MDSVPSQAPAHAAGRRGSITGGSDLENQYVVDGVTTIESFNGRFREECFERALVCIDGGRAAEDRRLSVGLQ